MFILSGKVGRSQSERIEQFNTIASEVEILSFGPSHAQAIHFPTLGMPGHAFFDSSGDLQVVDLKIRSLLDQTPKLKFAVVAISPGLLGVKKNRSETNDNLKWLRQLQNLPFNPNASQLTFLERWDIFNAQYGILRLQQVNQWIRNQIRFQFQKIQALRPNRNSTHHSCQIAKNSSGTPHEFGISRGYPRATAKPECIEIYLQTTLRRHADHFNKSTDEIEKNSNRKCESIQATGEFTP